jgi:hypothetical protein
MDHREISHIGAAFREVLDSLEVDATSRCYYRTPADEWESGLLYRAGLIDCFAVVSKQSDERSLPS